MAAPEKRRLADEAGDSSMPPIVSTPSRPPLKKRFTSSINIQQIAALPPPPPLVAEPEPIVASPVKTISNEIVADPSSYTKDKLLQNMRSAKDEALYQEKRLAIMNEKYLDKEAKQSLLRIDWALIQAEMEFIAQILHGLDYAEPPALSYRNLTLEQQKNCMHNNQNALKELGQKAFSRLEQWTSQADLVERKFHQENDMLKKKEAVSNWLRDEILDLQSSYRRGQSVMIELQKNLESLLEQTNLVTGNVNMAKSELKYLTEKLENCVQDVSLACKRQERSKSKLVKALSLGGLGDTPDPNNSSAEGPSCDTNTEEPKQDMSLKKEEDTKMENGFSSEQTAKNQIEEYKFIISARENEIEKMRRDRQLLLRDEEKLLSMFTMSEERLLETEYVKVLQLSTDHFRDRCYHLDQRRIELDREADRLSASRQSLVEQAKSEKLAHAASLEAEMHRLENDLNRIRGQRDICQSLEEEQTVKEAREKEAQDKIISFATQGKSRIASLEARINKLKTEQEMAGPFAKEANTFKSLKENIDRIEVLLASIELIESGATIPEPALGIQEQLNKWKSNILTQTYDTHLEEAQKASLMIEFLEKNESHLLQEIDRVAIIYGRLEDQQRKNVFDLSHKRDKIIRIESERKKFGDTFHLLKTQKQEQITLLANNKLIQQKQTDLVKQIEDNEKKLVQQVNEKEDAIRKLNKSIEDDRTDLEDITHLCEDYRITLDQNDTLINELQRMLKEKSKLLDDEQSNWAQVQENFEKMQRKWEKISQGDNPAEEQLINECEEMRALLKCSTCGNKLRSRILTRCMHTFCKNCIEARLNTRQRRCPTCSEPFGANDVKPFQL